MFVSVSLTLSLSLLVSRHLFAFVSLSDSHSLRHTHTHTLPLSLSPTLLDTNTHTHTHTLALSLSLSLPPSFLAFLILCLGLGECAVAPRYIKLSDGRGYVGVLDGMQDKLLGMNCELGTLLATFQQAVPNPRTLSVTFARILRAVITSLLLNTLIIQALSGNPPKTSLPTTAGFRSKSRSNSRSKR